MSKKTIFKRIALTAVSALAAGTLAVVSVPAANAAAADGDFDAFTGSIGVVGDFSPALADHVRSTTRTATILKTGTLVVSVANDGAVVVGSGALITGSTTAADISGDQTCAAIGGGDTASITPTGNAGTTFTVTTYAEDTCAGAATIRDVLTVTIAATDISGVASVAESVIRWDSNNSGSAPTAAEDATNSETTYSNTLELYIDLEDAYGQDIDSTTGSLIVTASSGAYLGAIDTSGNAVAGSAKVTTQVYTAAPSPVWLLVREATVGAGWNGTVTVSYNGVVIATKAGKITGAPAKIEVQAYKIGRTGATSVDSWLYQVKDAAGNALDFTSSDLVLDTSSNSAIVSDVAAGTTNASSSSAYGAGVGSGKIICTGSAGAAGGGTSQLVVKYTLSNGSVIKSNPWTATCGGDAYSYSASLDKASYIQGEIATMTITFKDAKGNLANSTTAVAALNDAGDASSTNATIATPMMTMVGTMGAGTAQKPNGKGQLTYKFTVGTASGLTAGKYNAVVTFPTLSTADAVSVAYEVGTGAAASVSTNEVLAAIVKLIATINKQIRQLQKQLRR